MNIFCTAPFPAPAQEFLLGAIAPHRLLSPPDSSAEAEVAFGQPDLELIRESPRLRWVHLTSAGFTRYDTPEFRALAEARGLAVTNSSSVYDEPCAEHALAFMLAQARRLPLALQTRAAGGTPEWLAVRGSCAALRGQTVVILGYGAIAAHLLKLLAPFEMRIVALRRQSRGEEPVPIVTLDHLPAALAEADHVIDILPENAASRGFMNAERFAAMKPGAVFYNIGRGATVEQDALLAALRSGRLAAAWLDVTEPEPLPPEHPLWREPNCFITPHTAGGHRDEAESLVRHFLENLRLFVEGAPLRDRVM